MADDHSRDRIPGALLWPYRPYSVMRFQPQALLQSLELLSEDIYVFDSSVSWTLVLTHENDGRRRIAQLGLTSEWSKSPCSAPTRACQFCE